MGLLLSHRAPRRWLLVGAGGTLVASLAQIAWILLLASIIDTVFTDGADIAAISTRMIVMSGILVLRGLALWSVEAATQRASNRLRVELRGELATQLVRGDPRRGTGDGIGEVTGALTEGVEAMGGFVTKYLPAMFSVVLVPLLVAAAVTVLDPPTVAILLFAGPMLVLLLAVIGRRTAELTRRRFDELGWLRGFYLDLLAGLGTLKAFGRSADGAEMIETTSRRFGDTTMEVLRTAFQTSLVMEWAATAATALVAVEVSFRLIEGHLSFGTALAVLVLTPEFFVPFRRLAIEYHSGQSGDAAAAAIGELLRPSDPAGPHRGGGPARITPTGRSFTLALEGVSYTYPGSDAAALDNLDLVVETGETLALVGPSGAGKSTIASLLLRFIDPKTGRVTVDGEDLCAVDPAVWRRQVAWIPQRPTLFAGTVAENISLGEPDATRSRIETAAERAGVSDVITALPRGFDTELGEGGQTLSGGERQRLAIARAFLRGAPLVLLDEFTAHLDPRTEESVLEAAGKLLEGRTALLIAHRVATARSADRIAVIHEGHVVETGTDADLMNARGRWYDMSTAADGVLR